MIIGFSNGTLHSFNTTPNERFSPKFIQYFSVGNVNAIELNCYDETMLDYILALPNFDLSHFSFVSLHAGALSGDDESSHKVLQKLRLIYQKLSIKNLIFHADNVTNRDLLNEYNDLPISIENMDNNKLFGRSVADIKYILDTYNFNLTLDLQHCFVNDPTMQLALDFQNEFKDRIVEYHISAYDPEILHVPLFKFHQDIIIDSLQYKKTPIIIESCFDEIGDQEKELLYIENRIR